MFLWINVCNDFNRVTRMKKVSRCAKVISIQRKETTRKTNIAQDWNEFAYFSVIQILKSDKSLSLCCLYFEDQIEVFEDLKRSLRGRKLASIRRDLKRECNAKRARDYILNFLEKKGKREKTRRLFVRWNEKLFFIEMFISRKSVCSAFSLHFALNKLIPAFTRFYSST